MAYMAKYIRLQNIPEKLLELILIKKSKYIQEAKGRHISDEAVIYKMFNECESCLK